MTTCRPTDATFDIASVTLAGWISAGTITGALVLICYRWVDRPVAVLAHRAVRPGAPLSHFFKFLIHLPDLLMTFGAALMVLCPLVLGLAVAMRRQAHLRATILIGSSYLFSLGCKTLLKWSFGRTWPETWVGDNPSFLRDGVYGFSPFHGGAGWAAFPSGHMTAVVSVAVMAWYVWPRLVLVWIAAIAGAGVGLVGMNLHFVSDVIAGGYVGSGSAAAVLWIVERWRLNREKRYEHQRQFQ